MAQITFNITTTSQMKEIIFFLYKSGLSIDSNEDDRFYQILYDSIKQRKVYPCWLRRENMLKYLEKIKDMDEFIDSDYLLSKTPMRPTSEFATTCGKENLTIDGLISKEGAYNFILRYIEVFKIPVVDDIIYMNEFLQNLLKINSGKIDKYELILLIDSLFIE
jgi:hypothetical protein